MAGGGGQAPLPPSSPSTGGEFLLSLLQKQIQPPQPSQSPPPPPPQSLTRDPAVAAVGPTIPFLPYPPPSNGHDLSSPPYPPNFFLQGFPRNPFPPPGNQFPGNSFPGNHFPGNNFPRNPLGTEVRKLGSQQKHEPELMFGSLRCEIKNHQGLSNGKSVDSSIPGSDREGSSKFEISKSRELGLGHRSYTNRQFESQGNSSSHRIDNYAFRKPQDSVVRTASREPPRPPPPGFPAKPRGGRDWDSGNRRKSFENNVGVERGNFSKLNNRVLSSIDEDARRRRVSQDYSKERELGLTDQLDRPGPPTGIDLHSVSASEIEESSLNLPAEIDEIPNEHGGLDNELGLHENHDSLGEQLRGSLTLEDRASEKNDKRKHHNSRDKDIRSDSRGKWLLSQRLRNMKRLLICRRDIDMLNAPFLGIYQSLVPAEEEKAKQKQLFTLLETIVSKEWPKSQLYLYGSCANSFGVSKSDIDVCLAIDDAYVNKSEILLRLADILQSDNLQNVQALTRARVPIVKLKDSVTGISCDICINNVLAVVNTKLLRDYAQIDVRLRQLAFIVKHWAKSRGVNETYQGTLSSYAYVVMCIHFLQQRQPAILPCLQGMETTYRVTVDDVECAFFDRVEKLRDFGSRNKESIAQLVWAFFSYWAYCHDYANDVISVRTGSIISKQSKDWTKRIGNDRHLICIEDPFEISHDLGRVVDKYSIRVLREEFERAADIMQYDPNPCVTLFEPYSPQVGILDV